MHLCLSFPTTGMQVVESPNLVHIPFTLEEYLQRVKPIAEVKQGRAHRHAETTADERHQLRRLTATMNWPLTGVMFCGSATLSIQAATVEKSMV